MAKKIQVASREQVSFLQQVSKELGEFSENKKSVILTKSQGLSQSIFSKSLKENHQKVLNLATLRGSQIFFLETFGIGYLLSIVCYGTYLISVGQLHTQDLALSLYAIYAALGIRGLNLGYTELKEKTGILDSLEENIGVDLTTQPDETVDKEFLEKFVKFEEFVTTQIDDL